MSPRATSARKRRRRSKAPNRCQDCRKPIEHRSSSKTRLCEICFRVRECQRSYDEEHVNEPEYLAGVPETPVDIVRKLFIADLITFRGMEAAEKYGWSEQMDAEIQQWFAYAKREILLARVAAIRDGRLDG